MGSFDTSFKKAHTQLFENISVSPSAPFAVNSVDGSALPAFLFIIDNTIFRRIVEFKNPEIW